MAKIGVLKKITALATAIALVVCFAVSASAINVATTTTYVSGTSDIHVNVRVTGAELTEGTNVTYYATKDSTDVHIDQTKVINAGTATFEFNTAATNLDSNVLVGYTGAGAATSADITGYTITYPGDSQVIATEAKTVTFDYALDDGKVFKNVTVTLGTADIASSNYAEGKVTVNFSSISGDVTLAVNVDDDVPVITATAAFVDAGALTVGEGFIKEALYVDGVKQENADAVNPEKAGDRKLTVVGKANAAKTYGVIVSKEAIAAGTYNAEEFAALAGDKYKAVDMEAATGMFAVQLIDTSSEAEAWVEANTTYNTAVYAEDNNGSFVVVAGDAVITTVTE